MTDNLDWKPAMVFFGYESDAKIAAKTFSYLFKLGNNLRIDITTSARQRVD